MLSKGKLSINRPSLTFVVSTYWYKQLHAMLFHHTPHGLTKLCEVSTIIVRSTRTLAVFVMQSVAIKATIIIIVKLRATVINNTSFATLQNESCERACRSLWSKVQVQVITSLTHLVILGPQIKIFRSAKIPAC